VDRQGQVFVWKHVFHARFVKALDAGAAYVLTAVARQQVLDAQGVGGPLPGFVVAGFAVKLLRNS
jgi:hypothetical protein